ncbi:fibronectin type III domain-containing protein [Tenacibaculum amylolyticum]|uniref:fibronectin type III domain-containing protein n=1 Tax=Tenacibaculum amylolyticum TaxID=104269 RepID=UPI00389674F5
MKRKLLFFTLAVCSIFKNFAQNVWEQNVSSIVKKTNTDAPKTFQSLHLNENEFLSIASKAPSREVNSFSSVTISLPTGENTFEEFKVFEASNFNISLAKKYPTIKSYIAKSTSSDKTARFSYSKSNGLNAYITTDQGTVIVKPQNIKSNSYLVYLRSNLEASNEFECKTIETAKKSFHDDAELHRNIGDEYLRKYKVAIATTGEYSNFFLTGNEADDSEKKETVLAAINTSLTRINAIFERDFAVTMELIANNDEIIFLDPANDPFSSGGFNGQLQNTLDTTIGSDNYDVGHLFAHEDAVYGNAGCIACVCTNGSKGSAYTVHRSPDSDHFNMIVAHEFGHQFGGYHVQSSSNCRSSAGLQEVEPGSGSTIMGYAGICSPNVQENPDDYFNYVDIRDIIQWTRNDSSCAELIATGNNDPTANAGNDYSIPRSTAFILEGTGNDQNDNSNLSYCWEQNDPENPFSSNTPQPTWAQGPLFRSKQPVNTPVRYMPQLEDVLAGNLTPTWEVIPSVNRTMDFVLTVRDNAVLGAKTASDEMTVSVIESAGPFIVTSQNSQETWNAGNNASVTWDVANTDQSPINVNTVTILLSVDGGYTYPHILAQNVPNNGNASFIVPSISNTTDTARIMVKADNNIFYAVNNTNFTVQVSEFALLFDETALDICQPNNIVYQFDYKTFLGFNETTSFSTENLPDGLIATFNPTTASTNNTPVTLTISGTADINIGNYNFNVIGTSTSVEKRNNISFHIFNGTVNAPSLNTPVNNDSAISLNTLLEWDIDVNAHSYNIDVATDNSFTNKIIDDINTTNNSFPIVLPNRGTIYYWRVKANNNCDSSNYSETYTFTTMCYDPANLEVGNITQTSAEISWIDPLYSEWEIEIIEKGTTPTQNGLNINTNNYTANNLNSGTEYEAYVRALCNNSNTSAWTGPISFTTLPNYCNGDRFYDSGGANGNYDNYENSITTITPQNPNEIVIVNFISFDLENCCDRLSIYDGPDINSPLIGNYGGNISPGEIISTNDSGSLTFRFTSDGSVTRSGWEANVRCFEITCPAPTDFQVNNILGNSAELSWANGGSETQWEIEYGTNGFTSGNGTKVLADSNPFTLTDLNPLTQYQVYLKATCGTNSGEDDSFPVGPISFETPCGTVLAPYTHTVETQNTNSLISQCWSGTPEVRQSSYFWEAQYSRLSETDTGPYKAYEGSKYFRANPYYNASNGGIAELLMPPIDISNLNNPVLLFNSFLHGEKIGSLRVDVYNGTEWTEILAIVGEQQTSSKDLWREHLVDLSAYSDVIQIRFRAIAGGNNLNEVDIDNIQVIEMPSCPNPTNISFSNLTAETADISWTSLGSETKWIIEYGNSGFDLGTGTSIEVDSNPFTLTNLTPNQNTDVYVKAICGTNPGDDDSAFIGPLSFKTPCGVFDAPYTYNINSQNINTAIEDCWSTSPEIYQGNYYWLTSRSNNYEGNTGPYVANSGSYYFRTSVTYSSSTDEVAELITPQVNIATLTNPTLTFYSFLHGENVGSLHVDIFNGTEWTEDIFVLNGEQQTSSRTPWNYHVIDLSAYTDVVQIKFRAIANTNGSNLNEIDIDDISFIERPNCSEPYNLTYNNITASSVDLSWTANGDETSWEVEYGNKGFTLGNGTIVQVNSNPFTLDELASNNEIDIYIKSTCSNTNSSNYVGPISLKTACGIYTAPWSYDVENQIINNIVEQCWEGDPIANTRPYYWRTRNGNSPGAQSGPSVAHSGSLYFATYTATSNAVEASLVSPIIDISTLVAPALTFYTFMHGENIGSLYVDIFSNGSWTNNVFALTGAHQTSATDSWVKQLINLDGHTGEIQIRFRSENGGYTNSEIDIDTIEISEMPSCPYPTNINASNITSNSVDLEWTSTGNESQWIIEYGIEGFTPGTGTQITVTSNPFNLTSLTSNTDYDLYVYASCTSETSSPQEPYKIKTIPDFCGGDRFYDSGGATGNYSNLENNITVISPTDGTDFVIVTFESFNLESCCDVLEVYDGSNINAPLIGNYRNTSPGQIIPSNSEGTLTFRFRSDGSVTSSGWEASVTCATQCNQPTNINTTINSNTSITSNWTPGANEQAWEIEYGTNGFNIGDGIRVAVNTNSYDFTNLPQPLTYNYYIRSVCQNGVNSYYSEWSGPYTFAVSCNAIDAPYHETFSSNTTPVCFIESGSENWLFNTNADYEAANAGDHTEGGGTNYAWIDGSQPSGSNQRSSLTTIPVNISQLTNPYAQFSVFSVNSYAEAYNTIEVNLIDTTGQKFNLLTLQENTDNGWKTYTYDISSFPINGNNIKLEFIITENSPNNPYHNDILIDDIKIDDENVLSTEDNINFTNLFKYYPNPVTDNLTIISNTTSEITKVEIYNNLGQKLISKKINKTNKTKIDTSNLPVGIYLVRVFSNSKNNIFRIVKQ